MSRSVELGRTNCVGSSGKATGRWIVMKFGGTSLGSAEKIHKVSNILKTSSESYRVIAVLSAMSRKSKTTGTTTRLLEVANQICLGSMSYKDLAGSILDDHLSIAREVFKDRPDRLDVCEKEIRLVAAETEKYLDALFVLNEVTSRSRNYVVGYGERLSAILLSHALAAMGIRAEYVSLHDLISPTSPKLGSKMEYFDVCTKKLKKLIGGYGEDTLPVLTGFIGSVPGGLIETVGRGYTDLTASLTAVGVQAEELQIWKEVDGVFTADPEIVRNARIIECLTPEEAEELTVHGSQVIHPLAMEFAAKNFIPVMVKNSLKPDNPGTAIRPNPYWDPSSSTDSTVQVPGTGTPTAVTLKNNVFLIYARPKSLSTPGVLLANIITILEDHGLGVSILSLSKYSVSIVFEKTELNKQWDIAMSKISETADFHVVSDISVVTLVGKGLRHAIGSSARMLSSLSKRNINIEMISQSISEISISVVVHTEHVHEAIEAVHKDCILDCQITEV